MPEETAVEESLLAVTSFEAFYRQTWPRVFQAVAVLVRDRDLANEATDEAMVRAYENWKKVSRMANPQGWAYRVATNWATSRLRRRALWRRLAPVSHVVEAPEVADPGLIDAVRSLPTRQRDVVVLRFLLDMSEVDTAEALGIPRGTVKSRQSRALRRLREDLS